MNTYWAFVKTTVGGFMKVTIQADNPFNATQMLKSMYGDKLQSSAALV